jgi:hypothetical protein
VPHLPRLPLKNRKITRDGSLPPLNFYRGWKSALGGGLLRLQDVRSNTHCCGSFSN